MGYRGAHLKLFHNTNFLLSVRVAALREEEAVVRGALDDEDDDEAGHGGAPVPGLRDGAHAQA